MASEAPAPTSIHDPAGEQHHSHSSTALQASPIAAPLSAATGQPKHWSELRPALSGRAYYIDGRSSGQYDAHLARPQSALVRGPKASPITSTYMIHDARRPSLTHSLPPLKPGSASTSSASRQVRSENASVSGYGRGFYDKHYSDRILGHPSPKDNDELEEYQDKQPRSSNSAQGQHPPPPPASPPSHILSTYSLSDADGDGNDGDSMPTARQTFRSLLHLSLGAAPLSFAIFFYTIGIIFYTLLTFPLRLCLNSRPSFSTLLTSHLIGPLNVQRKCIYVLPVLASSSRTSSSSRTPLSSDDAVAEAQNITLDYSSIRTGKLVSIHLLAPAIALPMTLCAWVMGVAWGLGVIVSDERAGDDRDERRLAQRLVDYWASWLNWGMDGSSTGNTSSDERRGRRRARPEMTMTGAR